MDFDKLDFEATEKQVRVPVQYAIGTLSCYCRYEYPVGTYVHMYIYQSGPIKHRYGR